MSAARHPWVAFFALVEGALLALIVARVLPARVSVVDVPLSVLALGLVLAAIALVAEARFAVGFALSVLSIALVFGLTCTAVLVLAAGEVSGVYGSVGEGIGLLFSLSVLVVVPYLVALPAAQLYFLLRARREPAR